MLALLAAAPGARADPGGQAPSAQDPSAAARNELISLIDNVPADASYGTLDSSGLPVGTIKIIQGPPGTGYIGVYHVEIGFKFYIRVATSTDLTTWRYRATLQSNASQPTIAALPNGGYLVAYEKYDGRTLLTLPVSNLEFQFYPSYAALLSGASPHIYDAPHTLSKYYEGTPSLGAITVATPPGGRLGRALMPLGNSRVSVGFHYYDPAEGVDRNATGTLTNFTHWSTEPNTALNDAFPQSVRGNIGGRDYLTFDGYPFTIVEAQTRLFNFGTWRLYLYDPTAGSLTELLPRTAGGGTSFGNPKLSLITDPAGHPALVVSLYEFSLGNGSDPPGPLVYFNDLSVPGPAPPLARTRRRRQPVIRPLREWPQSRTEMPERGSRR